MALKLTSQMIGSSGIMNFPTNPYLDSVNLLSSYSRSSTGTPSASTLLDATFFPTGSIEMGSCPLRGNIRVTFKNGYWINIYCRSQDNYSRSYAVTDSLGFSTNFSMGYPNGSPGYPREYTKRYLVIAIDNDNGYALWGFITYGNGRYVSDDPYSYAYEPGRSDFTVANIQAIYNAIKNDVIPIDPNTHGGLSAKEGGDGTFDDTSDVIDIPLLPAISVSDSGFVTIYNPTGSEMLDIANALISPNIFQALAQNFVKLSDVVIGLSIFPFAIPDGGQREVKINVLGVQLSTGVMCTKAARQFVDIDCGSIQIDEYWGNCLDYSPYTKISIYLPYCGYQELNTDEVMNGNLGVKYRVDLVSGACMAYVTVNGTVLYQFSGECSTQIPISSVDYSQFVSAFIGLGGTAHNASVSNGVASAAAEEAMGTENEGKALREQQITRTYNNARIIDSAVGAICSMKPRFMHAGALSASIGFLGVQKPFLIIERARQSLPDGYAGYHGYPSNITAKLGDLFGYTEVDSIHLNIPNATVNEIIECENLLKGGVVL